MSASESKTRLQLPPSLEAQLHEFRRRVGSLSRSKPPAARSAALGWATWPSTVLTA